MTDEYDIERPAVLAAVSRRCATRKAFERVAERIDILVVGDFVRWVLVNQLLGVRVVAGHRQKQREGDHHPAAKQVDCKQLCYGLGVGKQDSAARATRRDRIGERDLVEVLVDPRVGSRRQHAVRRPGHLEWREVIWIRAGPQQPKYILRVVRNFDPDGLHPISGHVLPEHPNAVFGAEHCGTDLYARFSLLDGPRAQWRIAAVDWRRPGGATGKNDQRAGQAGEAAPRARMCRWRAHSPPSISIAGFRNPRSKGCHGSTSICVSDVGVLSKSRTLRIPAV